MNLTTEVNGVTKRRVGNVITYLTPIAIAVVNVDTTAITLTYLSAPLRDDTTLFADLTETYGATDAEGYVDELAKRGLFFFDTTAILNRQSAETTLQTLTQFERLLLGSLSGVKAQLDDVRKILNAIAN